MARSFAESTEWGGVYTAIGSPLKDTVGPEYDERQVKEIRLVIARVRGGGE